MSHPKKPVGFTLVELLVVIGIIALLISMLLPALNKAREASNRVVCSSNQKQIYMAMLMYANESKGALPAQTDNNVRPNRVDWTWAASKPEEQTSFGRLWAVGLLKGENYRVDGGGAPLPAGYHNYPKVPILYCPTQLNPNFVMKAGGQPFASQQVSYYSSSISKQPRLWTSFPDVNNPGRQFKFTSGQPLIFDNMFDSSNPLGPIHIHNRKGINVVYGDGHGRFVDVKPTTMFWHTAGAPKPLRGLVDGLAKK